MKNIETVWQFVETYFPDYSSSDEIAENSDYYKITVGQIEGCAEDLYISIHEDLKEIIGTEPEEFQIIEEAQKCLDKSNAYIYEKAIEGYLESLKKATE